jgi:exopolyphosphatase/guanosine-5'-triphosphate,3'-diphosphate pyrophosphatase
VATIIPRWEWRTFGSSFGAAEASFATLVPTGVQESDELYLLVGDEPNVKVRDDLLDIKVLRETDDAGLQRWEPVLKASLPLAPDEARIAFEALDAELPVAPAEGWTLDALVAALSDADRDARAVPVHKRRVRYTVNGCTAEISEVTVGEGSTRTIAIESEDAAAVVEAVRSVGLDDYRNVSYPSGLVDLVERTPERFAVIDVGTNSVKFHLAARADDGGWRTVVDRAEVTRLGEGLAARGTMSAPAVERTAVALAAMAAEARAHRVRAIAAVGTAGLRSATDRDAVVEAFRKRAGVRVQVISGEDESRLAYLAVAAGVGLGDGSVVVFDTGGGSSQFTFGRGTNVDERFSVDVGAVRFTERFGLDGAVSEAVVAEAREAIATELGRLRDRPRADRLVGMGGAVTNLTAVSLQMATYDGTRIDGARLTREELDRQIERYRRSDADARRSIIGLQPKRAEVILAGACVVRTVMDLLGHEALTVSDRGLRHGVLIERFGLEARA